MRNKSKALQNFQNLIHENELLKNSKIGSTEFTEWQNSVLSALRFYFGDDTQHIKTFQKISFSPIAFSLTGDNNENFRRSLHSGLDEAKGFLKSVIREITDFWEDTNDFQKNISETSEKIKRKKIDSKTIFAIMSFDSEMEHIYEGMQAAGNKYDLKVIRVKDELGDYKITDKIIELINNSFLIIADLTKERPNVYFELGYSRGVEKTIITTAKRGTKLHFDVKDWSCIFYDDSRELEKELIKNIEHYLK
ncbi:hypothetical protein CLV96_3969 [Leptospira meyeri]|uniref:CD-NTase-associated protein 12/Pycsar effector protein TIR domain-containing protein n=1 Tax=Leptospira meyeri TaxID=29508 RepID=A0A4V3HHN8_LEPME|nr:hypothetical protein [Leptospira meyeri]EKJ86905.1 hypothetical protein LEP1GSC017_0440 [Leptospira meyeri serovar Hardjo str. Went 5]TDY66252.1 hypothetical protein CLV96_3969 [Leptospira meyeri]